VYNNSHILVCIEIPIGDFEDGTGHETCIALNTDKQTSREGKKQFRSGGLSDFLVHSGGLSEFMVTIGGLSDFIVNTGGSSDFMVIIGGLSDFSIIPGVYLIYFDILGFMCKVVRARGKVEEENENTQRSGS